MESKNIVEICGIFNDLREFSNENWKRVEFNIEIPRTNNKKDRISCVAWNSLANEIENKANSGEPIHILGEIHCDTWKKNDGSWQTRTYVNVTKIIEYYIGEEVTEEENIEMNKYSSVKFTDDNPDETLPF